MENKRTLSLTLMLSAIMALALTGCSSSEVSDEEATLPAEDLPVVDANTDALPNSIESPEGGADQLQPEAVVDVPDGQDAESANLSEQMASTEPAPEVPTDMGPSTEAPPSMNEMAPPVAAAEPAPDTSYSSGSSSLTQTYEVQAGDTLMKVAYKVYGDLYQWKRVYNDNQDRITDPSRLVAGTQLRVEHAAQEDDFTGYERYLIQNGDTLGTISNDVYGTKTKWKRLWQENDRLIKDPNRIYAGFFLRYSFTEQDRAEKDRQNEIKQDPQPLAHGMDGAAGREPTSANGPTPGTVDAAAGPVGPNQN